MASKIDLLFHVYYSVYKQLWFLTFFQITPYRSLVTSIYYYCITVLNNLAGMPFIA